MQSWLAFAYDALTNGPHPIFFFAIILLSLVCGGLAMGISWHLISQTRTGPTSAIPGLVFVIIGGGLIWISLRYGFEFLAVTPPRVSNSSLACNMAEARYGLIIDAGSSGSRIYIFCWKPSRANGIPWVKAAPGLEGEPPWEQEVEPGLSDYKANPQDVGKYLQPLIDYALKKIGNNPQTLTQTPLYLMATAGMRRLSESKLDSEQQQSIEVLKNVHEYSPEHTFPAC